MPRAAAAISHTVGRESGRGHRQSGHQARAGELFDNALAGAADAQAAARPMLGCAFTSRETAGLSSIRPTASSAITAAGRRPTSRLAAGPGRCKNYGAMWQMPASPVHRARSRQFIRVLAAPKPPVLAAWAAALSDRWIQPT